MSLLVPATIPDRFANRSMDDERLKKLWDLLQLKDVDDEETGKPGGSKAANQTKLAENLGNLAMQQGNQ